MTCVRCSFVVASGKRVTAEGGGPREFANRGNPHRAGVVREYPRPSALGSDAVHPRRRRSPRATRGGLTIAQEKALDLARLRLRQLVDDLDVARVLRSEE